MKNAVVFNRKKFAQLDALSCIVLFRIVSVDSIIVQFLYRDIEHTQNETKGKHRYTYTSLFKVIRFDQSLWIKSKHPF